MWGILSGAVLLLAFVQPVVSQQILNGFVTTSDRSRLFSPLDFTNPVNFVDPGATGAADIVITRSQRFQTMAGVGGTLSDNGARLLSALKSTNIDNYWSLLGYLFDPADGAASAGLSYLRITLGASDFSASAYSYDDVAGDTSFNNFNINAAPSYLYTVLADILSINKIMKVHLTPWSPPAWMKDSQTMLGGSLRQEYIDSYATYLLKCVQGFRSKGAPVYAINVQNEPQNNNPTYPTATFTPATEAQVANKLRTLLNNNGLSDVKLIGYDHNWVDAAAYPSQLMAATNVFDGVSFHCYGGSPGDIDAFRNAYPNKEIYFNECSGELGTDWWADVKWNMDQVVIGGIERNSKTALLWNIALDGSGEPRFPGTDSCTRGCRGIVTVNADGTWVPNQEFYALAQTSRAIVPRDSGGPVAQRIGVSVGGGTGWALRVAAFETTRSNSADWSRYSLVVLNWNDGGSGGPVSTTIEFAGKQASYSFPIGVTTLWWYAAPGSSKEVRGLSDAEFNVVSAGQTTPRKIRFAREF